MTGGGVKPMRTSPLHFASHLRRRLTAGRLGRRFAVASLMLGLLLTVVIGGSLYVASARYLIAQNRINVEANAALIARQAEATLKSLSDTFRELADNSVLATALVDSAGKETYLLPFLRSFANVAGLPVSMVFTDFEGVPIGDNGRMDMTRDDMAWLSRTIARGRPSGTIVTENGDTYLLAAEMLVYSRTASPEGAILYKVPLDAVVLHPEATLVTGSAPRPPVPDGSIAAEVPLSLPGRLATLGFVLRLTAPEAPSAYFAWALPVYGLVTVIALIAIFFGSRAAGNHLTRSLRDLEQLAATIVRDGFTGQRAKIRGDDEVTGLARTFNTMLDHIAEMQRRQEQHAAEEITIQRTLAERAELARADAEAATGEAERARQEALMALMVAERANAAKTHFLAAASHDLRQPVQSLVLLTSALAGRLADHPASTLVANIETALEALCRLLDAILDISKLDAGTVSPNFQTVSLGTIFERLEREYRLRAAEKDILFTAVPTSLTVGADPALLERIIRNLVENALRYTDRGRILLGCRRGKAELLIQVFDTGIGIPPEHLERIFHEFYQVSNPERDRGKGLGLGLAIVDRLARLLGYQIRVASRPAKGSCFSLVIPLGTAGAGADADAGLRPVEAPTVASHAGTTAGHTATALVIDDDPLVREGLVLLIEQSGWRVLAADSAQTALKRLAQSDEPPCLLIADYRLEGGATGLDAIRAVEATLASPPLSVVLTGDTAPERISDAQASGYRILHKPIGAKDITRLLSEAGGLLRLAPAR